MYDFIILNRISMIFLLVSQILFSCGRDGINPYEIENGVLIRNLKGQKYNFEQLKMPRIIRSKGDYLVVLESNRNSPSFPPVHLINKDNLVYRTSKGIVGFGPKEIANADLFDAGFNDSTFWIYSSISKRFLEFSLLDTTHLAIKEFKQPEDMYLIYKMFFTRDSTFLGLSASDKNRLVEYSIDGTRVTGYGDWDKIPGFPEMDYYLLQDLNKGWFNSNEDKTIFVKASIFRDRLEIFNYEAKEFKIIEGPRAELPEFSISGSGSNSALIFAADEAYGHRDIAFGENKIYNLYGGYNEEEILKTAQVAKTIYILSFTGKILARLDLDQSIRSLTIDESLGKIFGITTDEDPGIVVFEIPSELLSRNRKDS
jgi:hypothetical protein